MRILIISIVASLVSYLAVGNMYTSVPFQGGEVDLEASTITWVGKKVSGQHEGTISLRSGQLTFDNNKLTGGSFVMDMSSIKCTDIQGEGAANLVGHLSNEDFFDVAKHPTSELVITEVKSAENNGDYNITANLTIKGITHPISFVATVIDGTASADISIDRTLYEIKYGSGSFFDNLGDKVIDDEFKLSINLVLK